MTPSAPTKSLAELLVLSALLVSLTGCAGTPSSPSVVAPSRAPRGSATLYLPGSRAPQRVHFAIVDGVAVMGGDILLGPVETLQSRYQAPRPASSPSDHVSSAFAHADRSHLWPGAVIPYLIDASVPPALRSEIFLAISDVDGTRLSMRPKTPLDRDYVVFNATNHRSVCDSFLGRVGGPQPVRVNGCARSTVVHEILHAAGFDHEHQRPDRDGHVTILWQNIDPAHHVNFERTDDNRSVLGPYDYASVMHYRTTAFSRNGAPTIVARAPGAQIRDAPSLSPGDVEAIARLYADAGPPSLPLPSIVALPSLPGLGGLPLPNWQLPELPLALPPELFGGGIALPAGAWPDLGTVLAP